MGSEQYPKDALPDRPRLRRDGRPHAPADHMLRHVRPLQRPLPRQHGRLRPRGVKRCAGEVVTAAEVSRVLAPLGVAIWVPPTEPGGHCRAAPDPGSPGGSSAHAAARGARRPDPQDPVVRGGRVAAAVAVAGQHVEAAARALDDRAQAPVAAGAAAAGRGRRARRAGPAAAAASRAARRAGSRPSSASRAGSRTSRPTARSGRGRPAAGHEAAAARVVADRPPASRSCRRGRSRRPRRSPPGRRSRSARGRWRSAGPVPGCQSKPCELRRPLATTSRERRGRGPRYCAGVSARSLPFSDAGSWASAGSPRVAGADVQPPVGPERDPARSRGPCRRGCRRSARHR